MLKIRLQRVGRSKIPAFRLVVTEHTMPVQGRFIEKLGNFIGGRKDETLALVKDRIVYWISVGAKPSQTVARMLAKNGVKEAEKFIEKRPTKPTRAEREAAEKAKEAAKAVKTATPEAVKEEPKAEEVKE